MSGGLVEVTLVSASISPYSHFDSEPCSVYAVLKCAGEHQRTNNAEDQGRLPVWNESFSFEIQHENMSNDLVIQVFNFNREADELLGIGRIPILDMVGKEEATLCALINPVQGEIGKLKAVWNWKPGYQKLHSALSDDSETISVAYPRDLKPSTNTSDRLGKLEAVSDALARLSMGRSSRIYSASYPEETGSSGKEEKADKGGYYHTGSFGKEEKSQEEEYYSYPPAAPHGYSSAYPSISEKIPASYPEETRHFGREEKTQKGEYHSYPPSAPEEYSVVHSPMAEKYSALYPEDTVNFGKGERAQKGEYYPPSAPEEYTVANPPISETCARAGGFDYGDPPTVSDAYPSLKGLHASSTYPPPGSDAYPLGKDASFGHSSGMYPPPADNYPPSNQGYPQSSLASAYPPSNQGYPPSFPGSVYPPPPPPPFAEYRPDSAAYPPWGAPSPPVKESYHDPYSSTDLPSGGFGYMERGGGDMDKGGSGKDKGKKHGSHSSYGQPPPSGYPPSSYPPPQAGYPPYGHPPGSYPPAPYGHPQHPHGYPPAQHGYPPASHGYPPAPQGYPPASYPPQYSQGFAGPGYPMQGYPPYVHGGGHKSENHGYPPGAYVGHSSSSGKKHKEPKHSSSYKHGSGKKQKSFKGAKSKKFKMFKF